MGTRQFPVNSGSISGDYRRETEEKNAFGMLVLLP